MTTRPEVRLTNGTAEFAVTGAGLTAKGSAEVGGIAASFAWEENFRPGPDHISTNFRLRFLL